MTVYTTRDLMKMMKATKPWQISYWVKKGLLKPMCRVHKEYRFSEDAVKEWHKAMEQRFA